ncbi:MAG: endonuclease [Psychroserpens sp.]|nr:endonuclease [Psychroserpens sp.]
MDRKEQNETLYTLAFYNVENLFDVQDNQFTVDNDFLPWSVKRWTRKRYEKKLRKLAEAISQMRPNKAFMPPIILGIAEAENEKVLRDLIQRSELEDYNYDVGHYDSKDERGIDVGFIYNKDHFEVEDSKPYSVYLEKDNGHQDFTRDILWVSGRLNSEKIHCIINHWPSRRDGVEETAKDRWTTSEKVVEIITEIRNQEPDAKIIVMGDFNDNPNNVSIQNLIEKAGLFNPMSTLVSYSRGTLNHKFKWNMFDQILFSTNFFETERGSLQFEEADIFDKRFLTQFKGRFKGQPFRTYVGKKYMGGYSDHFPVFMQVSRSV